MSDWLPRDYHIKLTALECGALLALLHECRRAGLGSGQFCVPDKDGKPMYRQLVYLLEERVQELFVKP